MLPVILLFPLNPLLQIGPPPSPFSATLSWFMLFLIIFLIAGGLWYFKWLNVRFREENKNLSEKLSDRSYQVMMQKWELERKNLNITQQNQDIMDGLRYARHIQFAILPKMDGLKNLFSDSFVFYRPKDIVSGDFYFFNEIDDAVYLAVADCTGHGVAGAFMALVGNSLLHQIIGQKQIKNPQEILHHLNEGIVEALNQKESSAHGGLDIVLLRYLPGQKLLQFAGANRPLIYIRNNEIFQLKPDKLPIGGFQPDEKRVFTSKELQLLEGDRIYMYTDGYADQFGGIQGKKIMSKKFKNILLDIHQNSMDSQHKHLEAYFDEWRGRFEQVDDVLVIGLCV